MIVIAGHVRIDPDRREAAIAASQKIMAATRQEAGCISYTFTADLDDPGRFYIFEEWESGEALAAHFQTPHMSEFQQALSTFGVQELRLQRYEVSSVAPLSP